MIQIDNNGCVTRDDALRHVISAFFSVEVLV